MSRCMMLFLALLFLFPAASCFADGQNDLSTDSDTSFAHFPVKLVDDIPNLLTPENAAPFAIGGAAAAVDWIFFDQQNALAKNLQTWNVSFWGLGDFYGQGWVEGFGALGSWVGGSLVRDQRMQEFGRDAGESLVLATVVVTGLKFTVGRERPDGSNNLSFPSGHTITAFCIGPVVTKYWGWGAGGIAYALGTFTALSRVEGYHHYLSDCIAGATLGILIGNAVVYTPKDVSVGLGPDGVQMKLAFN